MSRVYPPRAEAARLRREVKDVQEKLQDQLKISAALKKKLGKSSIQNAILKNKNSALNRRVKYLEQLLLSIKNNISSLKKNKEKSLVNKVVKFNSENYFRKRAFDSSYNLGTKHYRQKKPCETTSNLDVESKRCNINNTVKEFYLRDENSSPAPGSSEFLTKNGVKQRKRYLNDTINNLYKNFCDTSPVKVSRGLFYRLKPFWVVRQKLSARNTCLCKQHSNFGFIFDRLKSLGVIKDKDVRSFLQSMRCNVKDKKCMYGECVKCNNKKVESNTSSEKTWYRAWISEKISRPGAKGLIYNVTITKQKKIFCTVSELVDKINEDLPKYLIHVYNKNHQYEELNKIKNNLSPNGAYVITDFSQNFESKYHEEIHNLHYGANKNQISLQTGVFFFKDHNGNLVQKSFCTFSDCLNHDAPAAWAMLEPVVEKIKEFVPDLEELHIQSDGPTTQYRNKTNYFLFHHFCQKFNLKKASWNHTEAGHGKTSGDGVGGCVKGMCNSEVICGGDVLCAQDMIDVVAKKQCKILTFLIKREEIEFVEALVPKNLIPVPQTLKIHQVTWSFDKKSQLRFRYLSCAICSVENVCSHYDLKRSLTNFVIDGKNGLLEVFPKKTRKRKAESVTHGDKKIYKIGEWIIVKYEDTWYPGIIEKILKKKVIAKFLSRNEKSFTWPDQDNRQHVLLAQILCKIDAPKQKSGKNKQISFNLTNDQLQYVENCVSNSTIHDE